MALSPETRSSEPRAAARPVAAGARAAIALLLLLGLLAALAIHLQNRLAEARPEDAPASEFSAARALRHLRAVAARPHPIGSGEHAAVRDYIVRELSGLGLETQTQRAGTVNQRWGTPYSAGTVENVLARLRGTQGGRALLLACHYDSAANSPGASDDGSGVVTLLETARALKAAPPLKNDIILLFTDGEEVGLLGANAFAAEHPWAKDVGVFLNFEARGNSGPVVMFETSGGNGDLIGRFAEAAPRPLANSFFYEIYQRLPNDTDFTVLKGLGGAQGMNFAYVNGINHYHTRLDTVEAVNPGSLQHAGSNALALARHFGDGGTNGQRTTNAVYFNVLGANFIRYPGSLVIPLLILAALLFALVLFRGLRSGEMRVSGVVLGLVGMLAGAALSAGAVWLAWWLVRAAQPSYRLVPWGEPYHSNAFRIGFVLLALAATSAVFVLFRRRSDWRGLAAGALIWWLILAGWASVAMPGGSYLFTLPLLFALLGLALVPFRNEGERGHSLLLPALAAAPGVLLWPPMVYNVFVALTLNSSWTAVIPAALLCGLIVPLLLPVLSSGRWLLPGLLALAAVCFIVGGALRSGFDGRRPKMNNVFYALDADRGEAVYASSDPGPDEWTAQFFNAGSARATMPEYFPGNLRTFLKSPAPVAQLAGPEVVLTGDRTEDGVRTLAFRVTSQRGAAVLSVFAEPDVEVLDSAVNGKQAADGDGAAQPAPVKFWGVQHFAPPPEGFDVVLRTKKAGPFRLFVVDRSYGLPELPGSPVRPRPEGMIPAHYSISDVTLVSKSFTF